MSQSTTTKLLTIFILCLVLSSTIYSKREHHSYSHKHHSHRSSTISVDSYKDSIVHSFHEEHSCGSTGHKHQKVKETLRKHQYENQPCDSSPEPNHPNCFFEKYSVKTMEEEVLRRYFQAATNGHWGK